MFLDKKYWNIRNMLAPKLCCSKFWVKKDEIDFKSKTILVHTNWGAKNVFGPSRKILGSRTNFLSQKISNLDKKKVKVNKQMWV